MPRLGRGRGRPIIVSNGENGSIENGEHIIGNGRVPSEINSQKTSADSGIGGSIPKGVTRSRPGDIAIHDISVQSFKKV